MRWPDLVALALRWPEVEAAVSYGEPSLKVRKRLLTRHRVADGSVVLLDVPPDERALLIEMMPEAFFCEPHYEAHDIVLAHLSHVPADVVERLLERRWRSSASKRAIAAFDG
ncbi:MAG: MmcQ/YjbR family DNA-binding protein [Pseudomonadota bacterium]